MRHPISQPIGQRAIIRGVLLGALGSTVLISGCSDQPEPPATETTTTVSQEPEVQTPAAEEAAAQESIDEASGIEAPNADESASVATPDITDDGDCETTLTADDAMKFNTASITVDKSCEQFTINLEHIGEKPKTMMGHNVAITSRDDLPEVTKDGVAAGLDNDYIKPNDDRVLVHTKIIGGGEQTSVSFDPSILNNGDYQFFCSFPGHAAMMKGDVVLVN